MRAHGVGIGDTFTVFDPSNPANFYSFDVVGEVVVNDALSSRPGVGALVTATAFASMSPESQSQTYAVYIEPGVDRDATLAALREAFPTTFLAESTPPRCRISVWCRDSPRGSR